MTPGNSRVGSHAIFVGTPGLGQRDHLLWWLASDCGRRHAQTKGAAPPSEAERMMRGLAGESDADFDALVDPCIVDKGRRICPGTDVDPDAAGKQDPASGADLQPKSLAPSGE